MTHIEFLLDTVNFYSEDVKRRAATPDGCLYLTEDGRRCAIGRYILAGYDTSSELLGEVRTLIERFGAQCLSEEIQDLDAVFLTCVQSFHDSEQNWDIEKGKGLTEAGEWQKDALTKQAWALDGMPWAVTSFKKMPKET